MQAPNPIFVQSGVIASAAPAPASTADTAFDALAGITAGFQSGTPTSVTSNEITVQAGQRVVLMFSQMRGTTGSPGALRTVSGIAGTGDFSAIDEGDMSVHEAQTQLADDSNGGVGVYIYSWVATLDGTGTFTLTWSGSVWATLLEAHVLPASELIASESGVADNAGTSIALDFGVTPNSNDLALTLCAVRDDDDESAPTDFTLISNQTGASTNRVFTAFDNGGVAQSNTWAGLNGSNPAAAAASLWRRT